LFEIFKAANDPDKDYIPSREEDRVGTSWQKDLSHPKHERGKTFSSDGKKQIPDQEFWADQYMFDNFKKVIPGNPGADWANPGAQSTPPYKK
jgi:hypothetical protein